MKKYLLLFFVIFSVVSFGGDIDEQILAKAKRSKLIPIPTDPQKQLELVKNKYIKSATLPLNVATIELGKELWFDPRLSSTGQVSCNTCHDLNTYGVDGLEVAVGVDGQLNPNGVNSPTVYNSIFNQTQFWNGRAKTLAEQAGGPLTAPFEMNSTPQSVEKVVNSIKGYKDSFEQIAPGRKIDFDLVSEAIAIFEATLITTSRYDEYLEGNLNALTHEEKEGFLTFLNLGCAICHNGINLGGSMQIFELAAPFDRRDIGVLQKDSFGRTKVPTLRNITQTYPYFHNGAVVDIEDAVTTMGKVQLGITVDKADIEKINKFFQTLDGKPPYIEMPKLPK
ncbi:cytochrome-c peroxidase [Campylobacter geochelonis]|uniref:Cytochrome c551 peroxidase n=1 Tax=Campylobacter geochelonis TaxID=1780362 RepID=A0A128EMM5_9BACT|nr:cytochrome c peroxidase [Campylobacter geochelonis]QKF70683.1 periplasmic diheme cytochrome c peroxidase [Campylobacter geochelonis]CZE45791.1 cytochrome c551 peroxidase [Campylobacter geochelonis]CZE46850.1 cytochrome c551 peroxidase [Campylobacter geochelonis]CZE50272.1 cytochrome c551 peroxidase [Campylobacter geochelonis]